MYKTIRHGENSLQYTILPQNDDFRIEGKLSSAGNNISSSSSSGCKKKSKPKRARRRSFFAYLGVLFVCTVIIGAILIPFLVSAECLPNPTEWFLKTKAAFVNSHNRIRNDKIVYENVQPTVAVSAIVERTEIESTITTDNYNNTQQQQQHQLQQLNIQSTIKSSYPIEKKQMNTDSKNSSIGDRNNKFYTRVENVVSTDNSASSASFSTATSSDDGRNFVAEVHLDDFHSHKELSASAQAIILTTARPPPINDERHLLLKNLVAPTTSAISPISSKNSLKNSIISSSPTIITRIMQVPLLKSASKKPIIPPVLAKTNSLSPSSKEIKSKWMDARWPYIDPSTYFQWTGYKSEDSVLLPALLGIALIGIIIVVSICLIARNKRTIVMSVRKRTRHDVEETGAGDNATLLTNTNLSDEE